MATILVDKPAADVKVSMASPSVFETGLFQIWQKKVETSDPSAPPNELLIVAPATKGEYPVIVFLHGFILKNSYYTDLLNHIASHGYIVVAPQVEWFPNPTLGYNEMQSTSAVTNWLPTGLESVLPDVVRANVLKLALMGHSRGGKTAFSLAVDPGETSLKFCALIGIDPVAGFMQGFQIKPDVLNNEPDSLNIGVPVMVIGTGLGEEKLSLLTPEGATKGLNHKNFYYECQPPCYHFVTKDFGHMDMLNDDLDIMGRLAACACKAGEASKDSMRKCAGGLVVAFLEYHLGGIEGDFKAILDDPSIAPATLEPVEYRAKAA